MAAVDVSGEFETIARLLAPLAHPEWGRGLVDDVAVVPSRPGFDLVLTKDAVVEGVHFLTQDPLDTVAQKLLRVNLSDLAAKGVEPFGYLLACHWSQRCGWPEREAFAGGLARDQETFGIALLGGDTVVTPGPAAFSVTLLGWARAGGVVGRNGARPGDAVFVTGQIGDGMLGLKAAKGELTLAPEQIAALAEHYRRPMPRTAFSEVVRDRATAALDVSDGLVADIGHIAGASRVGIEIDLDQIPVSLAGQAWLETRVDRQAAYVELATGGDDYEIAFTCAGSDEAAVLGEAERRRVRLTRIGRVTAGTGVVVRFEARAIELARTGWTHQPGRSAGQGETES